MYSFEDRVEVDCSEAVGVNAGVDHWQFERRINASDDVGSITVVLHELRNSHVLYARLKLSRNAHEEGMLLEVGVGKPIGNRGKLEQPEWLAVEIFPVELRFVELPAFRELHQSLE